VYLDISVAGSDLGRLVFKLCPEDVMPLHVENFRALAAGEKVGLDPKATYVGCTFEHSPMYVEGAQYKWCHVLKGKGRNAVGRPTETISDPYALKAHTHDAYGGAYYGLEYDEDASVQDGVVLVVPITGPGRGTSRFNIVRVGDSPPSWGTRLLMNQAIIGTLKSGGEVLRAMARQTDGKPTITACGEMGSSADAE
jgi:cyclophilin family peptidyl-prolyl cis-trans isomerase